MSPIKISVLGQQGLKGSTDGGWLSEILVPGKFGKVTFRADTFVGSRRMSRPRNEGSPVFPYPTAAGLCRIVRCTGKMQWASCSWMTENLYVPTLSIWHYSQEQKKIFTSIIKKKSFAICQKGWVLRNSVQCYRFVNFVFITLHVIIQLGYSKEAQLNFIPAKSKLPHGLTALHSTAFSKMLHRHLSK